MNSDLQNRPAEQLVDRFPLSFAQQRLWFLNRAEPASPVYNIPVTLRLFGALDVDVLARSLNEVVRRHEILRTRFEMQGETPAQVVGPPQPVCLSIATMDLTHIPAREREAAALRLADEEARQPFDLVQGPVVRTRLLCLGPGEYVLFLTMHHIVSDGWSLAILLQELSDLYNAFVAGKPSPIPDLAIQYADFAVWQRQWLSGSVLEKQLSYWRAQLAGSPPVLQLPSDYPRPAVFTYRGATRPLSLSQQVVPALRRLSQKKSITPFMLLLAAFQTFLHKYSGQDDIVVGSPIAGRTRVELERLIGLFVNTLVLRSDLSGDPRFIDLLDQVRHVTLSAYEHQDLPFEKLVEALRPERDISRNPIFQVMFSLQHIDGAAAATMIKGVKLEPWAAESQTAKFDLSLSMAEIGGELSGSFQYSTDLFEASTIERMADHFRTLLEGIVANPERRLSELPMIGETERGKILADWNDAW